MYKTRLILVIVFFGIVTASVALKCWQCGQYNDGVGSITPCINRSHTVLKECPQIDQTYCIKYVSEGSLVKDCVAHCVEKETWGTKTHCCKEDGCNSSWTTESENPITLLLFALGLALLQ
ncbi:uncharacterized protein LOC108738614 [Agrilus planipennis]|uniref:Uncharacterized protein LOC108738614 n=1 Tax=Agrilus planipennis TaxID=224129 RepID=A0A1W4WUP9_AGRPL|nr:uncharacterized protein LOC108738614 [Agrilus planipennis]